MACFFQALFEFTERTIHYHLAALGVLNIRIVDYDIVSLSNLNRQILYNETDIGNYKCDVAQSKILEFLPEANIERFNKKIECKRILKTL